MPRTYAWTCPVCKGHKPAQKRRGMAWCGCNPVAMFRMESPTTAAAGAAIKAMLRGLVSATKKKDP